MRTQWNDAEDNALDYLPHLDQVIYLRGIRRRMDYATGMAGLSPDGPISYSWLAQIAEVRPRACSTMKPPPRPDKNALRSVFDRLEAAGLVRRVRDHGLKSSDWISSPTRAKVSVPKRANAQVDQTWALAGST